MRYLIVDGLLNGTGIRDKYEGGYIKPEDLGLDSYLIQRINVWLSKYWNEHYNEFNNHDLIDKLDDEGKKIAELIKKEIPDAKLEYYSDAKMTTDNLDYLNNLGQKFNN